MFRQILKYKLLVKGLLVLSMAVMAMNITYADEPSVIEYFNEKEVNSLNINVKTTNAEGNLDLAKKALVIEENKLILDGSLEDRNENNKSPIKQRKTHYGIGYEYRKSILEETQTTQLVADSEKQQRVDRSEKLERPERPERINRPKKNRSSR